MSRHEAVARRAAEQAGKIVRERWRSRNSIALKSSSIDLVTDADRAAERAILEVLSAAFPDHQILAEESGSRGEGEHCWIVDPLDGTTNFAHSYPHVAISIALRDRGGALFGLVHDPLRLETFTAHRDGGAFVNGERLRISSTGSLAESLLATGFPYDRRQYVDFYLAHLKEFMMRTHGVRRGGSAALDLCYVAAGRVDGFWEWKLKPWDTAAGALVVEEAGGTISDFRGGPFDPFGEQCLATNGKIHDEMLVILAELLGQKPW